MRYQSLKLLLLLLLLLLQNGFKQRKNSQLFLKKCLRICHFVLEKLQMPHGEAKKYSANSPPWDNTKIVFSSN